MLRVVPPRIASITPKPSSRGMLMSVITTSGAHVAKRLHPVLPVHRPDGHRTPRRPAPSRSISRIVRESSMARIFRGMLQLHCTKGFSEAEQVEVVCHAVGGIDAESAALPMAAIRAASQNLGAQRADAAAGGGVDPEGRRWSGRGCLPAGPVRRRSRASLRARMGWR